MVKAHAPLAYSEPYDAMQNDADLCLAQVTIPKQSREPL
jgi:hypothetical protein